MKKLLLALLGLGLVAVIVMFVLKQKSGSGGEGEDRSASVADREAPPAGDEALYAVKIKATQKSSGPESIQIELDGTLSQIKQSENEYVSEWKDIGKLSLMNAASDPNTSAIFLHKPMITTIDGRDITHYLGKDFPKGLMAFQLSLLQKIFVGVKADGDKPILRTEKDEVGSAKVQYVFAKEGKNFKVTKTWTQYLEDYIKIDAVDNQLVYGLGPDGRLLSVEGTLTLHYRKPTSTHFTTYISVALKDHKPVTASQPKVAKESLQKTNMEQAIAISRQAPEQGQMTYEEALQKLDTITDKTDSIEVYAVFSALKADVITNPDHASTLVSKILDSKDRDPSARRRMSAMFGALAQSQAPAIADSLANLVTDCPDNFCKVQAMLGLNDHPNPSGANAAKMMQIANSTTDSEISGTALLAAGSIGKKLGTALPDLPKEMIAELNNPQKADMKSTVLAAMGNHGAADYYPALQSSLTAPDSNVRSAAVYSMRYLPNSEVNSTLVNVVLKEKDNDVTREAFKALQYRNLTDEQYVTVAEKSATLDNKDLQQDAARLLIEAYHDNPKTAEASLKALQEKTKFQAVKDYISEEMKAEIPSAGTQ